MLRLIVGLTCLVASSSVLAQTITEMYLDVPSDLVGLSPNLDAASKKAAIKIADDKNGYMELTGEAGLQLAKFSRKHAKPILAVAGSSYADGGHGVENNLAFYEQESAGKWHKIALMSPLPDIVINALSRKACKLEVADSASGTFRYMLPKTGRVILAKVESDVGQCAAPLFSLEIEERKVHTSWITRLQMHIPR